MSHFIKSNIFQQVLDLAMQHYDGGISQELLDDLLFHMFKSATCNVLPILIKYGANPNALNDDQIPILQRCIERYPKKQHWNVEFAISLVKHGATFSQDMQQMVLQLWLPEHQQALFTAFSNK